MLAALALSLAISANSETTVESDGAARLDVAALTRACDGGDAAACARVASAFETGAGVPHKNLVRSRDFYERGCLLGDALACAHYGYALETGALKTTIDPEAALAAYISGCDAGDAVACVRAGMLETRAKSRSAASFFERACKLGDAHGCNAYAVGLMGRDAPQAAALFRRACDANVKSACLTLATLCRRSEQSLLSPLRGAAACATAKPTHVGAGDNRVRGTFMGRAYSLEIPAGMRALDVETDARLGRLRLAGASLRGAVFLVPVRNDLDFPIALIGDLPLSATNKAADGDACELTDIPHVFSSRVLGSYFGRGCVHRVLSMRRTRAEAHLFLVKGSATEAFAILVMAENAQAEAAINKMVTTLRGEGDPADKAP